MDVISFGARSRTIANGRDSPKISSGIQLSHGANGVHPPEDPSLGDLDDVDLQANQAVARDSPVPLSPDALTAFASKDPQAKERNR